MNLYTMEPFHPIPEHYFIKLSTPVSELPKETKESFRYLQAKYNYNVRSVDFIILIMNSYGIDKPESFDIHGWDPYGTFKNYLIEQQIAFNAGQEVDAAQIHRDVLKVWDFSNSEKYLFRTDSLEPRLWAIFLISNDPGRDI